MKLEELELFLKDCIKAEIPFPRNMMKVAVEDFYQKVPEEHWKSQDLEYNVKLGQEFAKVIIIPDPAAKNPEYSYCESCEQPITDGSDFQDDTGNNFCEPCWKVLAPVMKAEYEELKAKGEL